MASCALRDFKKAWPALVLPSRKLAGTARHLLVPATPSLLCRLLPQPFALKELRDEFRLRVWAEPSRTAAVDENKWRSRPAFSSKFPRFGHIGHNPFKSPANVELRPIGLTFAIQ